ncbi:hypothetical protein VYU27_006640 [Nannochloropsis oceanica]
MTSSLSTHQSDAAWPLGEVDEFGRTTTLHKRTVARPTRSSSSSADRGEGESSKCRRYRSNGKRTMARNREHSWSQSRSRSRSCAKNRSRSRSRSCGSQKRRSRERSRSRERAWSPGPDNLRQWNRDKFAEVVREEEEEGRETGGKEGRSPYRRVSRDYVPPLPTWKSKAGGVYIPIVRK